MNPITLEQSEAVGRIRKAMDRLYAKGITIHSIALGPTLMELFGHPTKMYGLPVEPLTGEGDESFGLGMEPFVLSEGPDRG